MQCKRDGVGHEIEGNAYEMHYLSRGKKRTQVVCHDHYLKMSSTVLVLSWRIVQTGLVQCKTCERSIVKGKKHCAVCESKIAKGKMCRLCAILLPHNSRHEPTLCEDCKEDGGKVKITNWISLSGYRVQTMPPLVVLKGELTR